MRDLKDLLTRVKQEHLDRLGSIRRELKMLPPGQAGGFVSTADLLLSKRTGEAAGDHSETRTGATTGQKAVLVGGTEDFAA